MGKLKMHRPAIRMADTQLVKTAVVADRRITGRRLQARRFAVWKRSPTCAACGRVVAYPDGFELDHIVPLFMGGEDVESNCQVLCVDSPDGQHKGCHSRKTEHDLRGL